MTLDPNLSPCDNDYVHRYKSAGAYRVLWGTWSVLGSGRGSGPDSSRTPSATPAWSGSPASASLSHQDPIPHSDQTG